MTQSLLNRKRIESALIFVLSINAVIFGGAKSTVYFSGSQKYRPAEQRVGVFLGDLHTIYKKDIESNIINPIFVGNTRVNEVQASLTSGKIAAILVSGRPTYINRLIILDTLGNVIHEINEDVRRYNWSPDGSKIVFITGNYREAKLYHFTGHWILDINSGDYREISGYGREVTWARFDNNIYFIDYGNDQAQIYDLKTNSLALTEYYGIDFSPDGEYYYKVAPYPEGYRLFNRVTNEEIIDIFDDLPYRKSVSRWEWLNDNLVVIGMIRQNDKMYYRTVLINVKSGQKLIELKGTPVHKIVHDESSELLMEKRTITIGKNKIISNQLMQNGVNR